jgi:hypothetical protein
MPAGRCGSEVPPRRQQPVTPFEGSSGAAQSAREFEPSAYLSCAIAALLLAFEFVTKGNRFKLDPDRVHDGNHRARFEYKGGQH